MVIEKSEIQTFINKMFEAFDTNKDECISFDEFCEFIKSNSKNENKGGKKI
jgi:Ca2+-binding EF-hand superfamily protein